MIDYSKHLCDDKFVIFLFHGVINNNDHEIRNYTRKHIEADYFSTVIEKLCESGVPVSMNDIITAHQEKTRLPECAFAITFDDGFENNYSVAAPILRSYNVPSTIYVTTGFIESDTSSWIDIIESAFERSDYQVCQLPGSDQMFEISTKEQKIGVLNKIRQLVKNDSNIDPYLYASELCRALGVKGFQSDPSLDLKMNWKQIYQLHNDPLFAIGGHSHTHRILSYLSQSDMEKEIADSLSFLKTHLHSPIIHYSYPEGMSFCYSENIINELKKHGIVCCPSAEYGDNSINDDLFHLKRIAVI